MATVNAFTKDPSRRERRSFAAMTRCAATSSRQCFDKVRPFLPVTSPRCNAQARQEEFERESAKLAGRERKPQTRATRLAHRTGASGPDARLRPRATDRAGAERLGSASGGAEQDSRCPAAGAACCGRWPLERLRARARVAGKHDARRLEARTDRARRRAEGARGGRLRGSVARGHDL